LSGGLGTVVGASVGACVKGVVSVDSVGGNVAGVQAVRPQDKRRKAASKEDNRFIRGATFPYGIMIPLF
jgi:hypothetical protein